MRICISRPFPFRHISVAKSRTPRISMTTFSESTPRCIPNSFSPEYPRARLPTRMFRGHSVVTSITPKRHGMRRKLAKTWSRAEPLTAADGWMIRFADGTRNPQSSERRARRRRYGDNEVDWRFWSLATTPKQFWGSPKLRSFNALHGSREIMKICASTGRPPLC